MTSKYLIYGLRDPRTNEIRYVGQTRRGLKRPRQHLKSSNINFNNHLKNWVSELERANLAPEIHIFEELNGPENLSSEEMLCIARFKRSGKKLTNCTEGGEGSRSRKLSPETKMRLSQALKGKRKSQAHKDALRSAFKGKPNLKLRGIPKSSDHKKKLSESLKGKPKTPCRPASE